MKNIVIIPARGGSKRIPDKNMQLLSGLPLVVHSIKYALANPKLVDAVYVSTDSAVIKQTALEYGAKVIDRPEALAGDLEPTISALKQALETITHEVENVILLQPTNPLRPVNLLQDAFIKWESQNLDSLFTVSRNHHKLGKIINNQYQPFNYALGQRSQDIAPLFFENGLLYITKASLILNNSIISPTAFPFEVNHVFANVDIDTQEDLDYAAYLYQKNSIL